MFSHRNLMKHPNIEGETIFMSHRHSLLAQWEITRLRNVCEMRFSNVDKHVNDDEIPVKLCNYVDVYKNDRIVPDMEFMPATARWEEIERFRLQVGDVLVTKDSETWNDIGVSALVVHSEDDLICGYHLALLRPNSKTIAGSYLHWALQVPEIQYQFHIEAKGVTRFGLSQNALASVLLPIPPLSEQTAIVHYLDDVDGRIQSYISTKERLIELLTEQKQAVINQAVTRGLDPNVPLKPSGVEWLDEMPAHWEIVPIKRAFLLMDYGISESATDSGSIRLITMGHVHEGRVTVPHSGGVDAVSENLLLQDGDLLFNRTNSQELVGKVGLFQNHETPVTYASYLVRLRPTSHHISEYLNAVLNDVKVLSIVRREAIPSLHQSNLNPTRYGRIRIPLPPLDEQVAIMKYLKRVTEEIDGGINRAHRQIELMQEYRTRLIADVVTGKLDVRGAVADEIEMPTP